MKTSAKVISSYTEVTKINQKYTTVLLMRDRRFKVIIDKQQYTPSSGNAYVWSSDDTWKPVCFLPDSELNDDPKLATKQLLKVAHSVIFNKTAIV